jgi:hypothetical protein
MMKTSVRLLGASALVLGLMAAGQPAYAGNGKAALNHLPKDTAMVLTINVDRAKKSGLFKDAMAMAKKDPDFAKNIDKLKAQTGFDVRKHVNTLVIGFDKDFDKNQKTVVMVEGKFNIKRMLAFAKKEKANVVAKSHAGVSFWEVDGDTEFASVKNFMVITKKGGMSGMIDVHKGKAANASKNGELMRMIKGADTSKDLWFVGVLPQSLRSQAKGMLGGNTVDGLTASIDIRKGLAAKLRIIASSAAGAQALSGLMQAGLAQGASDPSVQAMGLGAAMKKISISSKANNVDVAISLTKAELDKITGILKSFMPN